MTLLSFSLSFIVDLNRWKPKAQKYARYALEKNTYFFIFYPRFIGDKRGVSFMPVIFEYMEVTLLYLLQCKFLLSENET